jgi:hypothetical protein
MRKITDYKQTKAVNRRGVTQVALIGYSHGGGSVYNLSVRMHEDSILAPANRVIKQPYTLVFTSYIDAVRNDSNSNILQRNAETRRPIGSQFHLNQYQKNNSVSDAFLKGDATVTVVGMTTINIDRSNDQPYLYHTSIDDDPLVQFFLTQRFKQKVAR